MKTFLWIALIALAPSARADEGDNPKNDNEKALYSLGAIMADNLTRYQLQPKEIPYVIAGLRNTLKGQKPGFDVMSYRPRLQQLHASREYAKVLVKKKQGDAYIEKMAAMGGAKKLPSGAVVIVTKEGTGSNPAATDTVTVHYEGTYVDGAVFDSSIKRKRPAKFALNTVIKCWTEGIQQLKVGGKAKLGCPAESAYGDDGRNEIPGGAALIYTVELLEVAKTTPGGPPQR
ncbi:MAG: FKBP-type peptidyl-prolyl cis-trans isomerase [Elusimicrobia bacterium]|nr:FKBP-type peptidyl-prolyl cis-trans isomerase [Elusimicrobiota bacterium]